MTAGGTGNVTDPLQYLSRPSTVVARRLLGSVLTSDLNGQRVSLRLTEVEAYDGTADPGSHAFRGRTTRNAAMFGPAGHVYVYFTYGMHWCANVVTGPDGEASAVLLRAGEVITGLEAAWQRRPACRRQHELASGPARLASCLGITGELYGHDLHCSPLTLTLRRRSVPGITQGPRVGVVGPGGDGTRYPWRFWLPGERSVSTYRAHQPRPRNQ